MMMMMPRQQEVEAVDEGSALYIPRLPWEEGMVVLASVHHLCSDADTLTGVCMPRAPGAVRVPAFRGLRRSRGPGGDRRLEAATHVEGGAKIRPRCCHKCVGAVTLKPSEVRLKELKRSRHWSVRESRDGAGRRIKSRTEALTCWMLRFEAEP